MKIIILGSGNAGSQFVNAFHNAGHEIVQLYSRNLSHARQLAEKIGCNTQIITSPGDVDVTKADVVVSALKDSVNADIWRQINFAGCPVFHTAGSIPMAALEPYAEHYGVLYPLQTLSKKRLLDFRSVPLYIEADSGKTLEILTLLATSISENVRQVDSEKRKKIHLAAVFANNFSNHMYVLAEQILRENGLPFQELLPLIDETTQKIHEMPPLQAQTGPAIRYDENVMNMHLEQLQNHPQMVEIYKSISKSIHEKASE